MQDSAGADRVLSQLKQQLIGWKFGFTWKRELEQRLKSKQKVVQIFLVFHVLLNKDLWNEDFKEETGK